MPVAARPRLPRPVPLLVVLGCTLAVPHSLTAQEPPPTPGERIRIDVQTPVASALGLQTPWEGTFIMVREDNLVASNPYSGGLALPLSAVQTMQVRRSRGPGYALVRGAVVGAAFSFAMWRFLKMLCRRGCDGDGVLGSAWLPAGASGLGVGLLVAGQGPGTHWVQAAVPVPQAAGGPIR